jgi:CDP-6-deoxy-D-xylo-4-hexulose-3-dehydrase
MIYAKDNLRVPYGLSVYNDKEIQRVMDVLKQHRSNMGVETQEFEQKISQQFGKKYGIMVNSGSSANFLAIELMNFPPGSEIITPLLTFSTTVAPLIQHGLIPVFVDVLPGRYIIDVDKVENLISTKTKAIMIPLLLGNVPDMEKLKKIAGKYNLIFIEDSCDTLGAKFRGKPTGAYSDITTTSFFGSHIITAGGNGGMITVNNKTWRDRLKVLRGWGRSSSLFSESESIEKRFKTNLDGIPYDAKFIFEEIGYNFLPSEIGAAFGNEQMNKLPSFRKTREKNFEALSNFFKKYEKFFILPEQDKNTKTQWLAFPLTIKENASFTRLAITTYLENNNVQTRPIFTGNILKQPGFKKINHRITKDNYLVTNQVMKRGFVIGCHHGMEKKHIDKLTNLFEKFLKTQTI